MRVYIHTVKLVLNSGLNREVVGQNISITIKIQDNINSFVNDLSLELQYVRVCESIFTYSETCIKQPR